MSNPYLIEGPALISFSGGRTSGYMLWHVLDAYNGKLPDDVHVCFANTGKEREETLRFVHECGSRWGANIRWLEWLDRPKGKEGRATPISERYTEVGYNSASRNGEPFKALCDRKGYLPNAVTRFCTQELKIQVMKWFMQSHGYKKWTNVIGLRGDEMHRVFKAINANENGTQPWINKMPMATHAAGMVRQRDVNEFWVRQGFDLGLKPHEGNCDLCFLKSRAKLIDILRKDPSLVTWWAEAEAESRASKPTGATFNKERKYVDLLNEMQSSPLLPIDFEDDHDAECGLWCGGEE
jgi:3'-phosphoadenosine 5'-phosphosulfate sulfotransferase (PAPS reductase)/FAD synthetase